MRHYTLLFATLVLGLSAWSETATTIDDQTDVSVTIYNNLALVRDQRTLTLPEGEVDLAFKDVAATIRPETVSLRSLAEEGSIGIYEQNFEYDLMSPEKLMEKYVGKQVKLINFSNEIGFFEKEAELMSVNNGSIYRIDGEIYLGHPGSVVLPEIPENLVAKPSLIWKLENARAEQKVEVSYLANNLSWSADYVMTLARDDKQADLAGWVTLNNNSGTQFTNAKMKVVAGDVNVVQQQQPSRRGRPEAMMMKGAVMMDAMVEESFAEYHLYTLPRRTTIKNNQSKQVSLLTAEAISMEKKYEFRGNVGFYSNPMGPMEPENVATYLVFQNEKKNDLGVPLPSGVIRVYQEDSEGMLQFAGEDRIKHTAKDEEVKLTLGKAFDVVAERIQTDYKRIANNTHEATFRIIVRNHKDTAVTVDVTEPAQGDWSVRDNSLPYTKKDAMTAIFSLDVPADGEAEFTYTMRITY